jgi:glutamate:GABA antiporter
MTAMSDTNEKTRLRRAMGFGDLVLFFVITGFAVRWVPLAAAAGPSAVLLWVLACLTFYVPLIFCVIELSSRYPDEGGLYIWTKHAFGEFAGFLTGWTYWTSVLPYFAGLLYFTAGNALYMGGDRWKTLAGEPWYFIAFSLVALAVATGLNVVGLNVGKWLHNLGAVSSWVPALVLIGLGSFAWLRFGSATQMDAASMLPTISFKNVLFVSTLAFTLVGAESASLMGEEVRDARRNTATTISTALAVVPPPEEENKTWAVAKVVGLALLLIVIGSAVYACGKRRSKTRPTSATKQQ